MKDKVLIDTTVFIHYFRGRQGAAEYLNQLLAHDKERCLVSIITVAELYYGCNTEEQEKDTEEVLDNFYLIQLNPSIMIQAGRLRRIYQGKKKPRLADMLIAATALQEKATLQTHNIDDFSWIPGLPCEIPYHIPS